MKKCREIEPLKTPYVDGEAGAADRADVDTHLGACGRCRDDVAAESTARDIVAARREELRGTCPGALRAAVTSAVLPKPQVVSSPRRAIRTWVPMSLAASLLLVVAAFFAFGLTDKAQALAFQTTIDHVKCARFNNSATPADPVAAGQQWQSRYGWPLTIAPAAASGLELRAVRRCGVTDGGVAHLLYDWKGETLSVYVLPADVLHRAEEVRRFGHDAVMWGQNGRTYIVLAHKARRPELDAVVGYVKANVH
jgi:anti-sigma factor RsiW